MKRLVLVFFICVSVIFFTQVSAVAVIKSTDKSPDMIIQDIEKQIQALRSNVFLLMNNLPKNGDYKMAVKIQALANKLKLVHTYLEADANFLLPIKGLNYPSFIQPRVGPYWDTNWKPRH